MVKIKGWKKVSNSMWVSTKNRKKYVQIDDMGAGRYIVKNEMGFNRDGLIGITHSKVKAIKLASEYMRKNSSGNKVIKVKLYGQWREFPSIEVAKIKLREYMSASEGAERERYTSVYLQLQDGNTVASDEWGI